MDHKVKIINCQKTKVVLIILCLLLIPLLPIQNNFLAITAKTNEPVEWKSQIEENIQDEYSLSYLAGWTHNYGRVSDAIIQEDLLYLIGGNKELFIVNVSDPFNPTIVGSYCNDSKALTLVLRDNTLFIAIKDVGLILLDVENTSTLKRIGVYNTTGTIKDICLVEDYSFLAKGDLGVEIISISNSSLPTYISSINAGGSAERVVYSNNLLFIANGFNGLEVYNISYINDPQKVANFTDSTKFYNVVIKENYAFILNNNSLQILNINDIMNIQKITEYPINNPTNIIPKDNTLFITFDNKISILNITEPTKISELATYIATEKIISCTMTENQLYLVEEKGIEIIEIKSETTYDFKHRFGYEQVTDIVIEGGYIYASIGLEGLVILDMRKPTTLTPTAYYNATGKIINMCKNHNFLYLVIENFGIEILNVQNPKFPIKVGEYLSDGDIREISIKSKYLFLADRIEGLKIFDINNPTQLQLISNYTRPLFEAYKVKVYDNILYVIIDGGYVHLFDYSKIITPNIKFFNAYIGAIKGKDYVDVVAMNNIVYLSTGISLLLVDISDINNIKELLTLSEGTYNGLVLTNNLLYIRGTQSIQMLEISKRNPIKRTEFAITNSYLIDFAIEKEYIVVFNIIYGDDLLLFNHTYPKHSMLKWFYIVIPASGIIIIITTFLFRRNMKWKK